MQRTEHQGITISITFALLRCRRQSHHPNLRHRTSRAGDHRSTGQKRQRGKNSFVSFRITMVSLLASIQQLALFHQSARRCRARNDHLPLECQRRRHRRYLDVLYRQRTRSVSIRGQGKHWRGLPGIGARLRTRAAAQRRGASERFEQRASRTNDPDGDRRRRQRQSTAISQPAEGDCRRRGPTDSGLRPARPASTSAHETRLSGKSKAERSESTTNIDIDEITGRG